MFERMGEVLEALREVAGDYAPVIWEAFGPNCFARHEYRLRSKTGGKVPLSVCRRVRVEGERLSREIIGEGTGCTGLDLAVIGFIHRTRLGEWEEWARLFLKAVEFGNERSFLRTVLVASRPEGYEFTVALTNGYPDLRRMMSERSNSTGMILRRARKWFRVVRGEWE